MYELEKKMGTLRKAAKIPALLENNGSESDINMQEYFANKLTFSYNADFSQQLNSFRGQPNYLLKNKNKAWVLK
jgi:hypothetical protein